MKINIDNIRPNPQQPRQEFNQVELDELASSIKSVGLLQPVMVEPEGDGFILISGERRLRAHKQLGETQIEAIVIAPTNHNGRERLVRAMVENIQRVDMNPMEEARAYEQLQKKYSMTQNDIGRMVGIDGGRIYSIMQLLNYDPEIQVLVEKREFPRDTKLATAIQKIPDKAARLKLADAISHKDITAVAATKVAIRIARAVSQKTDIKLGKTPALDLARQKGSYEDLDETHEPTNWNIFVKVGRLPTWSTVVTTAHNTCDRCPLRAVASVSNCSECPLVDFLVEIMEVTRGE
jgi:ParB family transcriptional regulator, chromosome partitioning protein